MPRDDEPRERDHIWPEAEGGPSEEWNFRSIPRSENRAKGPNMPDLSEVYDSTNPLRLAHEIDRESLKGPWRHSRNSRRGFGGLPRIEL